MMLVELAMIPSSRLAVTGHRALGFPTYAGSAAPLRQSKTVFSPKKRAIFPKQNGKSVEIGLLEQKTHGFSWALRR